MARHRHKDSRHAGDRILVSEVTVSDQPLLTVYPGADTRLPIEAQVLNQLDILEPQSLPNIPVSCLTSPHIGGFGRIAQAICLLDQVLKGFDTEDIDSKLLLLDRLDTNIQSFLSLVMTQMQEQPGIFCAAMHIVIRSVYLHLLLLQFLLPLLFHYKDNCLTSLKKKGRYSHYTGTS
jgi:hypothetical protein